MTQTSTPTGALAPITGSGVITGTDGADLILGSAGNDTIYGGAGNDTIDAGAGTNAIDAGAGDDVIYGLTGTNGAQGIPADGIVAGDGYDTLVLPGNREDYHIVQIAGGPLQIDDLTTGGKRDIITGLEAIQFADGTLVLAANQPPVVYGPIIIVTSEEAGVFSFSPNMNTVDPDLGQLAMATDIPTDLPAGVTFDSTWNVFVIDTTDPAFQSLAAGQSLTVDLYYNITDGTNVVPHEAHVTITGVNDAAVVSGVVTGAVQEDGALQARGQATATDIDAGQSAFQATTVAGTYGTLVMDASGAWVYTLDNGNAAVQALGAGQSLSDSVTVLTADGTEAVITVTIAGAAEAQPTLTGNGNANKITGTAGADWISGLGGNDTISGGGGHDTISGDAGADSLKGDAGNDRLIYDSADRLADGGAGSDTLQTDAAVKVNLAASDQTSGDTVLVKGIENVDAALALSAVTLTGNGAANRLTGGYGADRLTGAGGADVLTGGAASDVFVFKALGDSTASARDTVTDFTANSDVIDLTAIDAVTGGANDAFTFIGGAAFSAAGQLRYDAATGLLEADVNGDAVADLSVQLTAGLTLAASDFLL